MTQPLRDRLAGHFDHGPLHTAAVVLVIAMAVVGVQVLWMVLPAPVTLALLVGAMVVGIVVEPEHRRQR